MKKATQKSSEKPAEKPVQQQDDLTTGPIGRKLWSLGWPIMLAVFFQTLYNIVDAYWVSKISADAIAAVSISQITLFLMISLGFGVTMGSGVVMAMDIGAKNKPEAERVLGQSFVLTAILALVFSVIALLFSTELLTISGATGDILAPALDYFKITAGGSVLFFILFTIIFAYNSQGDTFTVSKLFAVSTLINVILDPIFIFGWGAFPALGISGAAIATLISQFVFIIIGLYSLSRPTRFIQFHFRNLSFQWQSVKQVLNIGIPAALTQILNPIGLAALTYIISSRFLEPGAVAFSLGFRVEFFAYLPAIGFGVGAMAIMGQSIGAGNMKRAHDTFAKALLYACGMAFVVGVLVALFAEPIIGAFTSDPQVVSYTRSYFHTVALSYAFLAAMMVEASAFQAMGHSWPGFWIMFLRFIVIAIPISYILTHIFNLPILAIWLTIIASNIIASLVGYFWISRTMKKFDFSDVKETVQAH